MSEDRVNVTVIDAGKVAAGLGACPVCEVQVTGATVHPVDSKDLGGGRLLTKRAVVAPCGHEAAILLEVARD